MLIHDLQIPKGRLCCCECNRAVRAVDLWQLRDAGKLICSCCNRDLLTFTLKLEPGDTE